MSQLKAEIIIESIDIVLYLLVESPCAIPLNFRQVGIEHHLYPTNRVDSRFEQGFVDEGEFCDSQIFITFPFHNSPFICTICANVTKTVLIASTLRTQSLFMLVVGCSCDAVGGGLPRRYLAWLSSRARAGCFSCQLSNIIHKKVDEPRRGCSYGLEAYADCHEDCRNTELNIQRGRRRVNAVSCYPN